MKNELKPKAKAPAAKRTPKSASSSKKTAAKSRATGAKTKKATVGTKTPDAKAKAKTAAAPKTKKTPAKIKEAGAKTRRRKAEAEGLSGYRIGEQVVDPIGDVISGEARTYLGGAEALAQPGMDVPRAETVALDAAIEAGPGMAAAKAASEFGVEEAGRGGGARGAVAEGDEAEGEAGAGAQAPAKLERLQKILSRAGIASRRRAEEMIVAGRVMVNGQVVTQLGSKADAARDHIRVDGKLLHGEERHRYFVLNKPRGFVTTVSDPEGRPTVMQFFAKMHERLYPVGRLDYQSEGLLLMTNDGELANLLTKAGSGVEKTYLVKVAGQPSEEEMKRLRGGVAIERGEAGSERVRTTPARIRQVRVGENPWYEVVLTEGRNRELRKMFAAIGHFAEKIRRVGYGPLALDVEPGKLRELTADEVNALRLTAEGKMKPRRTRTELMLPKEAGRAPEERGKFRERRDRRTGPDNREAGQGRDWTAGKRFGQAPGRGGKPFRPREERGQRTDFRPRDREFRGRREGGAVRSGERTGFDKRRGKPFGQRPEVGGGREGGGGRTGGRKEWKPREQAAGRVENVPRKSFRAQGERPFFKHGEGPKKRFEGERPPFKRDDEGKKRFEGESGKGFGKGAKFGAKAGGFGKPRGNGGRDQKRGFSRPGAQRGGWKRGSTRKPQS